VQYERKLSVSFASLRAALSVLCVTYDESRADFCCQSHDIRPTPAHAQQISDLHKSTLSMSRRLVGDDGS